MTKRTVNGYAYPEPTDAVEQGPATFEDEALTIDRQLRRNMAGILVVPQPPGGGNNNYAFILFPAGYFTVPPAVVVSPYNRSVWAVPEGVNVENAAIVVATRAEVPYVGDVSVGWNATAVGLGTATGTIENEEERLAELYARVEAAGGFDAYMESLRTEGEMR